MFVARLSLMIISTTFALLHGQTLFSKQLFDILSSLPPLPSRSCQFKFENCVQHSSYVDQFTSNCQIYARLRNCYSSLLDDELCRTEKTRQQYERTRLNEYRTCTSLSTRLTSSSFLLLLVVLPIFVHKFRLREKILDETNGAENKEYDFLSIGASNLATRKPIGKLKAIPISLRRLIVLTDNTIFVLDSDNFQINTNIKLKNILTFAVSTGSDGQTSGAVDLCVSNKRNKLQIYRLDKININLISELSVQECLISVAMDEAGIIGCSESSYFVQSFANSGSQERRSIGSLQNIFSVNDPTVPTCFTNISTGEYLLNGPNIGVTTSLQGISQRSTINFVNPPLNLIYFHPYLIVLVRESIQIYSYLDDQLKQEIPVKQCRTLTHIQFETTKSLLVTTRDQIFLLEPMSIKEQIEQLLTAYRLQEALSLAESTCTTVKQKQTSSLVIETKKRIALIEFAAMNVVRALTLFDEIHIDFHEIMAQIAGFLPLPTPWPAFDEHSLNQYQQWLNAFADYLNKNVNLFSQQPDFHSALLKAMIITKNRETIVEFVESCAASISLDCTALLLDAQLFHGAAVVFARHDQHAEAISIWKKLVTGDFPSDATFQGVWIIAKYLLERHQIDRTLQFQTAEWLLEQDEEELALKVFTGKYESETSNDPFTPSRVIQRLRSHPSALTTYLEHAVFKLQIQTDEIHTMLVNIYLDQILAKSDDENEEIRTKLQNFLITSNSYRVQSVLHRVNQTTRLRREVALLHGKMNRFDEAFRILIDELNDFDYAETYCVLLSQGKSSGDRKIVAHVLFKVLLASANKNSQTITDVLLRLLCNNDIEFDFIEVLQRLPSHWSLASIAQILLRALRTYSYSQRSKKIECALSRVQNEKLNVKLNQLKSASTMIDEYRRCKHCLQQFYETSCVVYQDGSQVHVHCAKLYQQQQQQQQREK